MLEQDYLLRLLQILAEAISRSMARGRAEKDPQGAIDLLDAAIAQAVDMDMALLTGFAPESAVEILKLSHPDPRVMEQVAQCLAAQYEYFNALNEPAKAEQRLALAQEVERAFCR